MGCNVYNCAVMRRAALACLCVPSALPVCLQRPLNTRDPVSLAGREQNFRNTPISWKGPNHEKCIVDKVMVTSEFSLLQGKRSLKLGMEEQDLYRALC